MCGTEPTVNTMVAQPAPAYWFYVLVGGGALLLLTTVTLLTVLCCHRCYLANKKQSRTTCSHLHQHHHSVLYHDNELRPLQQQHEYQQPQGPPGYPGYHPRLQPQTLQQQQQPPAPGPQCVFLPSAPALPSLESMLNIRLDKDELYDSVC